MSIRPASWRRATLLGFAAIAAGAAVWCGAWWLTARVLAAGFDRWVSERRADGWTVSHGTTAIDGFPLRWLVRVDRPHLSRADPEAGGFFWSGPWIGIDWTPWTPRSVAIRTDGEHEIGAADEARDRIRLTAGRIAGNLRFVAAGKLDQLDITGDAVAFTSAGLGPTLLNQGRLRADLSPDAAPNPASPLPSAVLDADLLGLTLPTGVKSALGRTIGRIAARAVLIGELAPGRPAGTLAAWREQGGVVDIEWFSLGWGALTVAGTGTVAVDAELQPIGALRARIAGFSETIDRLGAAGAITRNQGLVARIALGALARPPAGGGRPEVEVPIGLQDRILTVGPVPLLRVPRIDWGQRSSLPTEPAPRQRDPR